MRAACFYFATEGTFQIPQAHTKYDMVSVLFSQRFHRYCGKIDKTSLHIQAPAWCSYVGAHHETIAIKNPILAVPASRGYRVCMRVVCVHACAWGETFRSTVSANFKCASLTVAALLCIVSAEPGPVGTARLSPATNIEC